MALLGLILSAGVTPSFAATVVEVDERSLSPEMLVIDRGEEVIWSFAGAFHLEFVSSPAKGSPSLRAIERGDVAAKFDEPGEYRYTVHVSAGGDPGGGPFPGRIIVKEAEPLRPSRAFERSEAPDDTISLRLPIPSGGDGG